MKKLFILLIFGILPHIATSPKPYYTLVIVDKGKIEPFKTLWEAVCIVESGGNKMAYNERESAVGIAQIRPIRLEDYNQRTGGRVKLSEMYDPVKSKAVFMFYAEKHSRKGIEYIARKWNGSGKKTDAYWNRVKSEMEKLTAD